MNDPGTLLATARTAYEQRQWDLAHDAFLAADGPGTLSADDLAADADCAWWLGRVDESIGSGERAFRAFVDEARPRPAAMAAIGVAVNLLLRVDEVTGSGWLQRAADLLADEPECPEEGYLAYLLEVERALDSPDRDAVLAAARRVAAWGRRFGDATLVAAGLLGEGACASAPGSGTPRPSLLRPGDGLRARRRGVPPRGRPAVRGDRPPRERLSERQASRASRRCRPAPIAHSSRRRLPRGAEWGALETARGKVRGRPVDEILRCALTVALPLIARRRHG